MKASNLDEQIVRALHSFYSSYFDGSNHAVNNEMLWFPDVDLSFNIEEVGNEKSGTILISIVGSSVQDKISGWCTDNLVKGRSEYPRIRREVYIKLLNDAPFSWDGDDIDPKLAIHRCYGLFSAITRSKVTDLKNVGILRADCPDVFVDTSISTKEAAKSHIEFTVQTFLVKE